MEEVEKEGEEGGRNKLPEAQRHGRGRGPRAGRAGRVGACPGVDGETVTESRKVPPARRGRLPRRQRLQRAGAGAGGGEEGSGYGALGQ